MGMGKAEGRGRNGRNRYSSPWLKKIPHRAKKSSHLSISGKLNRILGRKEITNNVAFKFKFEFNNGEVGNVFEVGNRPNRVTMNHEVFMGYLRGCYALGKGHN